MYFPYLKKRLNSKSNLSFTLIVLRLSLGEKSVKNIIHDYLH